MSWERDRDADDPFGGLGRPGGDWAGVRPTLDNPLSWALPLFRISGIAVRAHLFLVLYIVVQLIRAMAHPHEGDPFPRALSLVALEMTVLVIIVLLHEFGHCIACRLSGGEADEILMWPLGGLAYCRPPSMPRAHLITALGGPLVNVAICVVLAPILGLATGRWWGVAVPNPLAFDLGPVLIDGRQPWWLVALFTTQFISLLLLLFNLLPIFPLDGGRILQALLWPRAGYGRSMRIAVHAGYFGAIALFIFGAVQSSWLLISIALFGGVTCYVTLRQLDWTDNAFDEDDVYAASLWGSHDDEGPGQAIEAEEPDREQEAEVDRILAKVHAHGLQSLSAREKKLLKRATDERRRGRSKS